MNEHKEILEQLNCNMCSFQASEKKELMNHIPSHGSKDQILSVQTTLWKCRNCGEVFESKNHLMNHRRDNHEMPMCYYDKEDKCNQTPEMCWYKHKSQQMEERRTNSQSNECFVCQEDFRSLGSLMEHKKTVHPELVKHCTKFAKGECRRVKCWFIHEN